MPRALITDAAGPRLTGEERAFFREADPLGLILFRRNVVETEQLLALTSEFREAVGRAEAPVLIDQEGGPVARLGPPHWWPGVAPGRIGALAGDAAEEAAWLAARLMAEDLRACGIDVNCAPCLDLRIDGMHEVIGERAFGADPRRVAVLGRAACDGFLAGGVLPVVKHLPGHGRVLVDPHSRLPRVEASRRDLEREDFVPFRALADAPWGMTAHVVYPALDPSNPASASATVISEVIRGTIGFSGLLTSDTIEMGALAGPHDERARRCLDAGCDAVLYCNQSLDGRRQVAGATPELGDAALARVEAAAERRRVGRSGFDRRAARERLDGLLAGRG